MNHQRLSKSTKHMRWWEWLHNKQTAACFQFLAFSFTCQFNILTSLCILLIFHCKSIFLYASNHYECNRVKRGAHHPIHKVQVPSRISCTSLRNTSLSPWGYILFFSATIACWLAFLASFWRGLNIKLCTFKYFMLKVVTLQSLHPKRMAHHPLQPLIRD